MRKYSTKKFYFFLAIIVVLLGFVLYTVLYKFFYDEEGAANETDAQKVAKYKKIISNYLKNDEILIGYIYDTASNTNELNDELNELVNHYNGIMNDAEFLNSNDPETLLQAIGEIRLLQAKFSHAFNTVLINKPPQQGTWSAKNRKKVDAIIELTKDQVKKFKEKAAAKQAAAVTEPAAAAKQAVAAKQADEVKKPTDIEILAPEAAAVKEAKDYAFAAAPEKFKAEQAYINESQYILLAQQASEAGDSNSALTNLAAAAPFVATAQNAYKQASIYAPAAQRAATTAAHEASYVIKNYKALSPQANALQKEAKDAADVATKSQNDAKGSWEIAKNAYDKTQTFYSNHTSATAHSTLFPKQVQSLLKDEKYKFFDEITSPYGTNMKTGSEIKNACDADDLYIAKYNNDNVYFCMNDYYIHSNNPKNGRYNWFSTSCRPGEKSTLNTGEVFSYRKCPNQ